MICEVENEYVPVIWFEYRDFGVPVRIFEDQSSQYALKKNGHNLIVTDMNYDIFLRTMFECHLLISLTSDNSIPIANFTTLTVSGKDHSYLYSYT